MDLDWETANSTFQSHLLCCEIQHWELGYDEDNQLVVLEFCKMCIEQAISKKIDFHSIDIYG